MMQPFNQIKLNNFQDYLKLSRKVFLYWKLTTLSSPSFEIYANTRYIIEKLGFMFDTINAES